jgi:DNA transposition AAA+ family ATPase
MPLGMSWIDSDWIESHTESRTIQSNRLTAKHVVRLIPFRQLQSLDKDHVGIPDRIEGVLDCVRG